LEKFEINLEKFGINLEKFEINLEKFEIKAMSSIEGFGRFFETAINNHSPNATLRSAFSQKSNNFYA
jgi:hypothetical protein